MSLQLTFEQTPTTELDSVLAPLAAAADAQDERAFLEACDAINWRQRTAAEFIQAIQWAFAAGAHMAARQLARLGTERHPVHSELQKYARILAPPQVIARKLPPDASVQANRDWLMTQGPQFAGKWVAVRDGELLGVADSLTDLTTQFGIKREILFTRVR